ncbi:hypothetical protein [Gemella sanguinis]|uniref:hypothetical protein n=1 Tax=Gemella sanguinis TaxID=84135 RepID=UPI0026EEFE08|nr:hypothetical protein [Gemella sanguinis]
MVAISGLLVCNIKQNDSLLIIGASGEGDLLTLQLAKALGCRLTAICSSKNIPLAYKYGVDRVFDYSGYLLWGYLARSLVSTEITNLRI